MSSPSASSPAPRRPASSPAHGGLPGSRGPAGRVPSDGRAAGLALALLSALAFGGSGTAAKPLINAGLPPLQMVWLRATGAALVLLPLALRHWRLVRQRPGLLLGFGLFAVAGVQACYFAAISRIPVGVALLIEYLGPVLLLGWVRFVQRRPVTRAAAVGAALAVTGLACVVQIWSGFGGLDVLGVLAALGAACCQVVYFLFADARPTADGVQADPLGTAAFGLLIGAAALTPVARPWTLHWALLTRRVAMGGHVVPAPLLLAWVVLVATVLAYLTGVSAVRLLSPPVAGVVACVEAVVATVLAWVLLGEHLDAAQLFGGLLVIAGALAAQSPSGRRTGSDGRLRAEPAAAGHGATDHHAATGQAAAGHAATGQAPAGPPGGARGEGVRRAEDPAG